MPNRFGDEEAAPAGVNRFGDSAADQPAQVQNPEGFGGGLLRNFAGLAHLGSPASWMQAAAGLIQSHVEQGVKAKEAFDQGRYSEAIGHLMATALPGVGPAAAHAGEAFGGTEARYDSKGNVIQPGMAPSLSAGAGETVGILAPEVLSAAAPKVSSAASAAEAPLRDSAAVEYGRVLNATTKGNKLRSQRVAPELAERGVTAMSLKGLQQKIAGSLQRTGQELSDAYDALPADSSVPLDDVLNRLQFRADQEFTVPTGQQPIAPSTYHQAGLALVDDIKNRLTAASELDPQTGFRSLPVGRVRQMRQMYDEVANLAGRYDGKALADHSQAAVQGMAADALRGVLADNQPSIAALNKEYSFWKDADRVVSDTITRKQGQAVPLGVKIAKGAGTGAGYVTGGPLGAAIGREAMGALERTLSSPAWRTVSAVAKTKLANALASGNRGAIESAIRLVARPTALAEGLGAEIGTTSPSAAAPAQ